MNHTAEEAKNLETLRHLIDGELAFMKSTLKQASPTSTSGDLKRIAKDADTCDERAKGMCMAGNALGFTTAELMNNDYGKKA